MKITLTALERREANAHYFDPEGWKFAEGQIARHLTRFSQDLAAVLEYAVTHPEDADSARIVKAVRRLMVG